MRKPFLSRLLLGGALVATIAFGALAMRATLPAPEIAAVSAARPATASDADPVLRIEQSDSTPETPVSGASTLPADVAVPKAHAPSTSTTGGASTDCAGKVHDAASCPNAGDAVETMSRPTIAIDGVHAPAQTSSARASRGERRVSSGPMRMLGGGESTW
jgi:hypothetical protein